MTGEQTKKLAEAVTGTFMWSFKKGDNIIYNFEVLWELYHAKKISHYTKKERLNKPIILILVAIIECILDDFVDRIQQHRYDGVPNITHKEVIEFRSKKLDKFEHYIATARKYNLFDRPDKFYDVLGYLRDARNRLHIQNEKYKLDADEHRVFTDANLVKAERVMEIVLETMMRKYPRGNDPDRIEFKDVELPWHVGALV
jgi:hypothetical protein